MYLFDFINQSFGILSFYDVMLGNDIAEASNRLKSLYSNVDERFEMIIPTIKGKLLAFDDKYILDEFLEIVGNPITSIEIHANFDHFPYPTYNNLEAMESNLVKRKYMEQIKSISWEENSNESLNLYEKRNYMCNLLYEYYSYIGITDTGQTVIRIKVAMPKHNLNEASKDSVAGTYTTINHLLIQYRRYLNLLENNNKEHCFLFPHRKHNS